MNDQIPKIYLFYCATSCDQEELMRSYSRQTGEIKAIPLPCSGKLDILYLTKAFDTGADGAVIMMCKEGECRYMEGNLRSRKRAQAVDELLQEAGLGKGRVKVIQIDEEGMAGAVRRLEDFRLQIKTMVQSAPDLQASRGQ
ncbi:MAG TPA: hydrogenase iron-sulfur subunit [Syntrophorhabdaceae bacterium]|nr:hydrogenase iron-sulfur subunit [Syntrophorhabdaceae bacterium]